MVNESMKSQFAHVKAQERSTCEITITQTSPAETGYFRRLGEMPLRDFCRTNCHDANSASNHTIGGPREDSPLRSGWIGHT